MRRIFLMLFILALAALSLRARVYFVVSPPQFELTMVPGQIRTETINIINGDSANPLRLRVLVKGWEKSKNGQIAYFEPSEQPRSCGGWLAVNPSEFELPARGVETVRFTITAPESVIGSYWAMIFFESQPDTTIKGMIGMRMVGRVGASVYVNIDGTLQYQSEMTGLTYKRGGYKKHEFTVGIKNDGNVYFRPKGALEIKDASGKKVNATTLPDNAVVFPGAQSDIKIIINEVIPPGRYTANLTLDCGQPELLEGEVSFEVVP